MKSEDPDKLDLLLVKADYLNNKKKALKDPNKESDSVEKARVSKILEATAKGFDKSLVIPIADLRDLFSCDRMISFAEKTEKAHDNALEVLADLQKVVPQKTP